MQHSNRAAWLVLGSGVVLGCAVLVYYAVGRPGTFGLNYRVYHAAATAALAGEDMYAAAAPDSGLRYLYPPATVLAFLPSGLVGDWLPGYLALTAASVAASAVAAAALCRYVASLGHAVPRSERLLVFGFFLASAHAAPSLGYGQVNHLLVAALAVGLVALARDREARAGVALALPAFVKVFPGLVGLWLLRRRAWRAVAAAVGTAAALTAAGLAAFGADATRTYVVEALLPRRETAAFVGGLAPERSFVTLRRPLSVAFPGVDPAWYAVGAAALLAPALAVLYWRPATATDRHVAVHGTLVSLLLFFPSLLLYYAYTSVSLVVLLYDLPAGRGRRIFVAGAALANLSLSYGTLREVLRAAPVDDAVAAAAAATARPVLAVGTPVLYGCLLMLAGCVVYRVESGALARAEASG